MSEKRAMSTRNSRWLIIGIAVICIVTVLTIVSIVATEGRNPGYKITELGDPIVFCEVPIRVYVDNSAKSMADEVRDVLDVYEDRGVELLYMGVTSEPLRSAPAITVFTMDIPDTEDHPGYEDCYWDPKTGCVQASNIYISPSVEGHMRYMILCHEFGHSVGLDHSSDGWSVMNKNPGGMTCTLNNKEQEIISSLYSGRRNE